MSGPIAADPPGDCNCNSRQRMHWVFPNAVAMAVEANKLIEPEVYVNPLIAGALCHTCTGAYFNQPSLPVWLDTRSVLVAAPASDPPATNRAFTAVRLLERDPFAAAGTRRIVTTAAEVPAGNFATDRIALASSSGLGFLVIADNEGNSARLSIYDPRCDVR